MPVLPPLRRRRGTLGVAEAAVLQRVLADRPARRLTARRVQSGERRLATASA
jgi:hypothetical protein